MSSTAEVVERAIGEILAATLPVRLRGMTPAKAREWVGEHIDFYLEEKTRLPWSSWIAYDDWELPTFFVVLTLTADAVELFCGTGHWPEIRRFGEHEADDIPAADLYREWSARFAVPCPPLVLGKATVKEWLGRDWT
jgi:hypothetical protein